MPNTTGPSKTPGTTNRIKTAKKATSKAALEKFKYEVANEVGVTLKDGYNGDLTSAQAGSIGGQMVKKMVESYEADIKSTPTRTYSSNSTSSTTGTTSGSTSGSSTKSSTSKTTGSKSKKSSGSK